MDARRPTSGPQLIIRATPPLDHHRLCDGAPWRAVLFGHRGRVIHEEDLPGKALHALRLRSLTFTIMSASAHTSAAVATMAAPAAWRLIGCADPRPAPSAPRPCSWATSSPCGEPNEPLGDLDLAGTPTCMVTRRRIADAMPPYRTVWCRRAGSPQDALVFPTTHEACAWVFGRRIPDERARCHRSCDPPCCRVTAA